MKGISGKLPESRQGLTRAACLVAVAAFAATPAFAADWPQSGYDPGHGASSPEQLPAKLSLQWVRQMHKPRPAWPESQPRQRFDASYSPVAAAGTLFVPSMVADSVTALDAATGAIKWRFFADGPVRFAPIADGGKVYFASDDGCLYCVSAADGKQVWRATVVPKDRRVIGNSRVISTWPVRGGPVLLNGRIYLAAGLWPFMGMSIHAYDAAAGRQVWFNSGWASAFREQPHDGASAFSGFVPCGQLAASESGVAAPGGRTEPVCFDPATGDLRFFSFGAKNTGGMDVKARGAEYFLSGEAYAMDTGKRIGSNAGTVHAADASYGIVPKSAGQLFAVPVAGKGKSSSELPLDIAGPWSLPVGEDLKRLHLKAGDRFYVSGAGVVAAVEVDLAGGKASVVWKEQVQGEVWDMLAADGRLFVVTTSGAISCFAAAGGEARTWGNPAMGEPEKKNPPEPVAVARKKAGPILGAAGTPGGYAVVFGLGSDGTAGALALAAPPDLQVLVVEADAVKVAAFRRAMDDAGLYGTRVAAIVADPLSASLPPYMAELAVLGDPALAAGDGAARMVARMFSVLRPYGGAAVLGPDADGRLKAAAERASLPRAKMSTVAGAGLVLTRAGALPGSADWTHQYADAANTVCSKDELVKAPLGLLWFGGPPNDEVLPRHGHGPAPQVAAGRLFIEGRNMLRAIDAYTGRLLWQRDLANIGVYYDIETHQPGANAIGGNYVSTADSVYAIHGRSLLRLDAATGRTVKEFLLPPATKAEDQPPWGYIGVLDDILVMGSGPMEYSPRGVNRNALYGSSSRSIVAMDRRSGKVLWSRDAKHCFRHNNIVLAGGRIYCIDGASPKMAPLILGEGEGGRQPVHEPRLLALDLKTGREIWTKTEDVFGTFLNYSAEHDVLLQGGSAGNDRATDEITNGMLARRGKDGSVLWKDMDRRYNGPCILWRDSIITQIDTHGGPAFMLLTGGPRTRADPLTGKPREWRFWRYYGCNTATASRFLLLFRSGAAGYFDLAGDGGTGNFGGFKSSCTSNLIPADGLLLAPEYTRTCICNYQNQTSLAMIHDPDAEMWTFNGFDWDGSPIKRIGVNLGANGDRRDTDGTLWLEFPRWGGPSPEVPVETDPAQPAYFRIHSSFVDADEKGGALKWVVGSGASGLRKVTVTLAKGAEDKPRAYIVRLHFMEASDCKPGDRVCNVKLQGEQVLAGLDVVKEAGGVSRGIAREFKGVKSGNTLEVSFEPVGAKKDLGGTLSGIELVAEGW